MAKTLQDYILTAKKQYDYRLKFAFMIDEGKMSIIERVCDKYKLIDIKKPIRVPFTKNPLDFKNTVENVEVYIVDITTDYPASLDMLKNNLQSSLNCPEKFVVVVDKNHDPYGDESSKILKTDDSIDSGTYTPKLFDPMYTTDGATVSADDLYGDDYNGVMLQTIGKFSKDQQKQTSTPSPFTDVKQNSPKKDIS